jgi:hypothetical protein
MKLNNKGFGLIGIILSLLIIAILLTVGWTVYHHDHKTKVISKSVITMNNKPKTTSQTSNTPSPTYMDITQWGVKVQLSSPISGLYYVPSSSSQGSNGQPNTMWLGLTSITDSTCTPTALNTDNTELAAILQLSPSGSNPVSGQSYVSEYPYGTVVGNYYYALDDSRTLDSGCASQSILNSVDMALRTAVRSMTSD